MSYFEFLCRLCRNDEHISNLKEMLDYLDPILVDVAFLEACKFNQLQVVQLLMDKHDPSFNDNELFYKYAREDNLPLMKLLFSHPKVQQKLSIEEKFETIGCLNDTTLFDEIVKHHNPRDEGLAFLVYDCARWGSIEIVERLLPYYEGGGYQDYLEGLCHRNDIIRIKKILPRCNPGLCINALQICCEHEYVELVKLLLRWGVDPEYPIGNPIYIAREKHNLTLCKLLVDHGALPGVMYLKNEPEDMKSLLLQAGRLDKAKTRDPKILSIIKKHLLILMAIFKLLPMDPLCYMMDFLPHPFTKMELRNITHLLEELKRA